MKLLLDTQIALWWLLGSPRLKAPIRDLIAGTESVLSIASVLEVAIKHRIGKLPVGPKTFVEQMRSAGATILSLSDLHAAAYANLPQGHDDPFDLTLLAVASTEGLMLVTADQSLQVFATNCPNISIQPA